ncbi:unnamed protein product, partial [Prunus brigantina]
ALHYTFSALPFLLLLLQCLFAANVSFAQRESSSPVDFELAGWGAAMEDFRSFLEMLWRPLIFVWGVELRIQRPFRLMKLCLFVVIFPLFLQPSSQAPFYEFLRPLSSG